MRQIIFAAAACFCLLIVCQPRARAQSDLHAVKATFVTSVGGQEAARESYLFTLQAGGILRADAEVVSAAGSKQKLTTIATRMKPQSFTAEANGAQVYGAEFGEGTVKVHKAGQPDAELPTKATVVLENLVWHQFHFLFAQYDMERGGLQTFTFFAPSSQKDFEITVERLEAHTYMLTNQQVQTDHYRIVANKQFTLEAWVGSGRTPLVFYAAAQQIEGVRVGMEGLARQVLAGVKKTAEYQPPAYSVPTSYTEKEVTVGAGTEWALPATLTMPVGAGAFPAVVLVHGSGPNDRDETIQASKPFRDLALGLASQGIAVLRYDKRTRVYGAKLVGAAGANFTVKEETIDDALAAVSLLRQTPGIDPKRIFIIGHSLGAGLAPRIVEADPQIRGLVVMAGLTTPLEDTIVRQYEYLLALDGSLSDDDNKFIANAKQQTARIKQLTKADLGSKEMLHGAPVAYWLDLRAYDALATAQRLKQPMLVIQGERDYNVTMTDFAGWQRLAARKKNVTTKSYPKLDHLFLEGEGPSTDAQYAVPRNIPKYVIDDIAAFVKSN